MGGTSLIAAKGVVVNLTERSACERGCRVRLDAPRPLQSPASSLGSVVQGVSSLLDKDPFHFEFIATVR